MREIVEILKKHQLRRIARSDTFTTAHARHVTNKSGFTKLLLQEEDLTSNSDIPHIILRDYYHGMMTSYTGVSVPFAVDMNKRSKALWKRVEAARKASGCTAERYLKAQFVWFDKAFGAAPTPVQLATEAATERAKEFTGPDKGRVLGNIRKAPVTKADVFRASEKTLQEMMLAQDCNREEFYKKFVLTGLYTFPKEFLGADPTYQRLIRE